MNAQTIAAIPTGEYYLHGVAETASGFKINTDKTFQFFFSQGALDRQGQGNWKVEGSKLILNSEKVPARDFAMISSVAGKADSIKIQITDLNTNILRYVRATVKGDNSTQQQMADNDGLIMLAPQAINTIELEFAFCPEKKSVFHVTDKKLTSFEFRFEPWLFDFFFTNFSLTLKVDGLVGPSPVMEGEFTYEKND